jgi:membrane glycosyltransferase
VLVLAMLVLLYGPKLLAVVALLEDPSATRAHGGAGAVVASAVAEAVFSTLMAPIVMLQHSWYVLSILVGMATGWNAQTRADRALPLGLVARKFAPHTLAGAVAGFLLYRYVPLDLDWFIPLLAGPLLAIPVVVLSSSPLLGRLAREDRLFLVPSETLGSRVVARAHALAASHEDVAAEPQRLVLEDPTVRQLHLALLNGAHASADPLRLWSVWERVRRHQTAGLSREDWALLLSDAEGLRAL